MARVDGSRQSDRPQAFWCPGIQDWRTENSTGNTRRPSAPGFAAAARMTLAPHRRQAILSANPLGPCLESQIVHSQPTPRDLSRMHAAAASCDRHPAETRVAVGWLIRCRHIAKANNDLFIFFRTVFEGHVAVQRCRSGFRSLPPIGSKNCGNTEQLPLRVLKILGLLFDVIAEDGFR